MLILDDVKHEEDWNLDSLLRRHAMLLQKLAARCALEATLAKLAPLPHCRTAALLLSCVPFNTSDP